jgi:hypothetical protein
MAFLIGDRVKTLTGVTAWVSAVTPTGRYLLDDGKSDDLLGPFPADALTDVPVCGYSVSCGNDATSLMRMPYGDVPMCGSCTALYARL